MLIDQYELFSSAQAITAAAASTNSIDLRAERYIGVGARPLYVVAQVTTAFTDSGSDSTLTVKMRTDTDSAMGSTADLFTIGTFAALAAIGDQLVAPIPFGAIERYVDLYYTPNNGNLSTGSVTAFITADPQYWKAFAKGYTGPTTA